jgi:hypothetical protein
VIIFYGKYNQTGYLFDKIGTFAGPDPWLDISDEIIVKIHANIIG